MRFNIETLFCAPIIAREQIQVLGLFTRYRANSSGMLPLGCVTSTLDLLIGYYPINGRWQTCMPVKWHIPIRTHRFC